MGTPAPPNEPGGICSRCFGDGRKFPGVTPRYVDLTVSGVQPGRFFSNLMGGLPNGKWRLTQIAACGWRLTTFDKQFVVLWSPNQSLITCRDRSLQFTFFPVFTPELCLDSLQNSFKGWSNNATFDGNAKVTWPTEGL